MLIDIFDGIETARRVPITEAFPDKEDCDAAEDILLRESSMFVGGGAAPYFWITVSP